VAAISGATRRARRVTPRLAPALLAIDRSPLPQRRGHTPRHYVPSRRPT
jgi:hypothetical protein